MYVIGQEFTELIDWDNERLEDDEFESVGVGPKNGLETNESVYLDLTRATPSDQRFQTSKSRLIGKINEERCVEPHTTKGSAQYALYDFYVVCLHGPPIPEKIAMEKSDLSKVNPNKEPMVTGTSKS